MKGLELPISTVVIIVIALVVLLAMIALFFSVYSSSSGSTTLEIATRTTCSRINPTFCQRDSNPPHGNMYAARMPVYNFDANQNGSVNEHTPDSTWPTSYEDDNLEMLCDNYYYCGPSSLITEADWTSWIDCCVVKICGCPAYAP